MLESSDVSKTGMFPYKERTVCSIVRMNLIVEKKNRKEVIKHTLPDQRVEDEQKETGERGGNPRMQKENMEPGTLWLGLMCIVSCL